MPTVNANVRKVGGADKGVNPPWAREFVIPDGPIPAGAKKEIVDP